MQHKHKLKKKEKFPFSFAYAYAYICHYSSHLRFLVLMFMRILAVHAILIAMSRTKHTCKGRYVDKYQSGGDCNIYKGT